jgi:undecaprenyl-diphosphatase
MDTLFAAVVMGIVQGLTEFLPVSSSGHLIAVPYLLGGVFPGLNDPFIQSLGFSVMLHIGTLIALLLFFARDWLRIVPAFFGAIRERSMASDPDRRLAVLIAVATVPALILGFLLHDVEALIREVRLVAITLVIGGAILWLAERSGSRRLLALDLSLGKALGIGVAQALALVPGISRSGISISGGLFAGLRREEAARFSFLLATPITGAAAAYETVRAVTSGELGAQAGPLAAGLATSFVFGIAAIAVLLRFLRTRSTDVFVAYRVILAAAILVVWLG